MSGNWFAHPTSFIRSIVNFIPFIDQMFLNVNDEFTESFWQFNGLWEYVLLRVINCFIKLA
jgi:hypothetical protein